MRILIPVLWLCGAIQLADVVANVVLAIKIRPRQKLSGVPPLVRQIFFSHWFYLMLVLVIFSCCCFFFAPELAGGSLLGRFLSGALGLFWLLRVPSQLFYFDADFRRQHRLADIAFVVSSAFLAVAFGCAALGAAR
jgi:energy-coupling factor transporter transmembrane protein EcfT